MTTMFIIINYIYLMKNHQKNIEIRSTTPRNRCEFIVYVNHQNEFSLK